jgi:crotonobetainyl-CoA:carnitine CoA-transferase CaiB-like acyl-CoA transferase
VTRSLPLASLRVLDLSRVLAGPLCAMTLGDLGADVIKVERPGTGDETRGWGPPFDEAGDAAYFLAINRNKRSIALDLEVEDDRAVLRRLIAGAHVVIDNFRPGTLERRGLGVHTLLDAHPQLLWCTITGFGLESPRPGYDFVVQAEAGWMAITGEPEGAPMKVGVALADVIAGKDAAIAVLAALADPRRDRPAAERHLVVSLAHSAAGALVNVAQNVAVSGAEAGRWGNAHPNLAPYELFAGADRPLVIAVGTDPQWVACARALGLDDLAADPALVTNAGRLAARGRISAAIADRCRSAPAAAWIARLDAVGVPCGVVRSVREALELFGVDPLPPGRLRRPPPRLDAHRAAILATGWENDGL